jgi:hypothetical protein
MPITFLTRQNILRIFKHIVPKRRFHLGTICLKILRIFCGSRGRKICFRPVISSRSYLAIFIPNEISSICFVTSVSRRRLKIGKSFNSRTCMSCIYRPSAGLCGDHARNIDCHWSKHLLRK